jgi:hypothetical protein
MMNRIGNRLYATIGLIGAVITIIPWALSNSVRVWARDHSNWLYGALVLASIALVIILGYARDLNRENRELNAARKRPTRNDVNMLREIMAQIPRDGTIMRWLKTGFFVKVIPYANLEDIDEALRKLSLNPLEFDDNQLNVAYERFMSALADFRALITLHCNFEDNRKYDTLRVPLPARESEAKGYYEALNEIDEEVDKVTSAYDDFLRICSTNGLDIYSTDASSNGEAGKQHNRDSQRTLYTSTHEPTLLAARHTAKYRYTGWPINARQPGEQRKRHILILSVKRMTSMSWQMILLPWSIAAVAS